MELGARDSDNGTRSLGFGQRKSELGIRTIELGDRTSGSSLPRALTAVIPATVS